MDRAAWLRWFAVFAALMAVPLLLIWSMAGPTPPDGDRALGNWPLLSSIGTAVLVAGTLTMICRTRTGREASPDAKVGFVSGIVMFRGEPVSEAKVTALRAEVEVMVEPDGSFALEHLEVGRHVLEISDSRRRILRRIEVHSRQVTFLKVDLDAWAKFTPQNGV